MKSVHVLLFDGYADWEIGYILPELKRMGKLEITSVGFTKEIITSMGGLKIEPDITLNEVDITKTALFIIPGGGFWEKPYPQEKINSLLKELVNNQIPVAAICAATIVFANANILTGVNHTSNSLDFLRTMTPDYNEYETYANSLSVCDKHIITASGLGAIEFTKDILTEMNIGSPEMRVMWYDAFKSGKFWGDDKTDSNEVI